MIWRHFIKPDINICSKEFCFFWNEVGSRIADGINNSLGEALSKLVKVDKSYCGCNFGVCIRNNSVGVTDWFEPVEPLHTRCNLPLFYFKDYSMLSENERILYNKYFESNKFKRVKVKLKLTKEFYTYRLGSFKNSIISTVARFENQDELDNWSIVAEIHDEPNENRELVCGLRFLVDNAPSKYLEKGNKFIIADIKKYADGIVLGEELN